MANFYIDFSGFCVIDAETKEEAEEKFWKGLQTPSTEAYGEFYEIDGIEEHDSTEYKLFLKF